MHLSHLPALLAALVTGKPAPAPKVSPARKGKHANGHRSAKNADKLRKSRQKMSKESRRRNRR